MKNKHSQSYGTWKQQIKKLIATEKLTKGNFEGDKDIDGIMLFNPDGSHFAYCEWDGYAGIIEVY